MAGTLQVTGLTAGFGARTVFADLSLPALEPGQLLSLIGPNAAGKSTLLRAIAGLLPAQGSIRLGLQELQALPLARRAAHVSYMPQALPQPVALTVLEAVTAALRVGGAPQEVGAKNGLRRGIEALEEIGIAALAMTPLDRLSGGQRQLVSLAQVLVRASPVLLLDEPVSALDLHYQLRVMKLVRAVARRRGAIAIIVLHDLALAARWSDQVAVLAGGRVVAAGTPAEAITAETLSSVYKVKASVEVERDGRLDIVIDDVA